MHQTLRLHELLYVSTLAPDASLAVVADIARTARNENRRLDITGLLVFDGLRFAQHLEGPIKAVVSLFERIQADIRHIDVCLLHQGELQARKFRDFAMGFADVDGEEVLEALSRLSGAAAVGAFLAVAQKVDRSP